MLVAGDKLNIIHLKRLQIEKTYRQLIESDTDFLTMLGGSKRLLFPINLDLAPNDLELLWLRKIELENLGFEFDEKTKTMIASPTILDEIEAKNWVSSLIEDDYLKMETAEKKKKICQKIARSKHHKINDEFSEQQFIDLAFYAKINEIKHRFDGALIQTEIKNFHEIEKKFK